MRCAWLLVAALLGELTSVRAAGPAPAPQRFLQETATAFTEAHGLPKGAVRLLSRSARGTIWAFSDGQWFRFQDGRWLGEEPFRSRHDGEFTFPDAQEQVVTVALPWREVRQVVLEGATNLLATSTGLFQVARGQFSSLDWSNPGQVHQIARAPDGTLHVASSGGLFRRGAQGWERVEVLDAKGRCWSLRDVLALDFDEEARIWFGTPAGVAHATADGWSFFEGKDGLPWNEFTCLAAKGRQGSVWFGTKRGAIRYDGKDWHYRQGPLWLPNDRVQDLLVDPEGAVWVATEEGVGRLAFASMTLAEKAERYEREIEQFIARTPFGYVAEAHLRRPGDRSSADPQDSDNDGLWTSMYGAGECFAYGATHDPKAKARAQKAFEALRFLQKVTQGGSNSPPDGYVARTIRPVDWPNPNVGRLEGDRENQKSDSLWKVYEPRWPKSADGKWYWKSDTSSDELDGHYFFYPLYYDLCADTEAERERVRDVVRRLTDHLLTHNFVLMDHDGRPTRWAVYGPQFLNRDPRWWPERGLNSLSLLSYLSVAEHITGDRKYGAAVRDLVEQHGYAHNAMYPKVQHGPGSGNQSDDEMAFMCFYNLLRYSRNEVLKPMIRFSFFRYWVNEATEMNPFFNFAYAACNLGATITNVWGEVNLQPWAGWQEDSLRTLYGFPIDRLNWPHQNSHRLDLVRLSRERSTDVESPDRSPRGQRVNGKVLPVENRYFTHWNTDPWRLDYGGSGDELGAGTAFLLPYYMGMYHGYIEKPGAE